MTVKTGSKIYMSLTKEQKNKKETRRWSVTVPFSFCSAPPSTTNKTKLKISFFFVAKHCPIRGENVTKKKLRKNKKMFININQTIQCIKNIM